MKGPERTGRTPLEEFTGQTLWRAQLRGGILPPDNSCQEEQAGVEQEAWGEMQRLSQCRNRESETIQRKAEDRDDASRRCMGDFSGHPSGLHRHMTPKPAGMTSELTGQTKSNGITCSLHIDLKFF